jgi:hypothetical protein
MSASTEVVEAFEQFRPGLEADGYSLDIEEQGAKLFVKINAGPDACEECLVPKDMMLAMFQATPPLDRFEIDLRYPVDRD